MHVRRFTVGAFQVNTYLLTDPETGTTVLIDTGESEQLGQALQAEGIVPQAILLTHAHLDHAGALKDLQDRFDVPAWMPRAEIPLFQTLPHQGSMFGMPHLDRPAGRIDHFVEDGDEVTIGSLSFRFVSTPGHTPGQGCWWIGDDLFVGDTLFKGSIGRTDFPLSNPALAVASLRKLLQLPGELRVHSGHGPVTTLAQELQTNPFLGYLRRERGLPVGQSIRWAPGT